MYEYANRFAAAGHQVTILHSLRRPFKKMRSPLWWKRLVFACRGAVRPAWFPLDDRVNSKIVDQISDAFVPDGDILFSTWWQTAYALATLSPCKGVPVRPAWFPLDDRVNSKIVDQISDAVAFFFTISAMISSVSFCATPINISSSRFVGLKLGSSAFCPILDSAPELNASS